MLKRRAGITRLFAYGSLQPGGSNEHVLAEIRGKWQPGKVRGHLQQKGWGAGIGYPGLVLDEQGDDVEGHVLTSPKLRDAWGGLDRFEGAGYQRELTSVTLSTGETVDAYVYTLRSI